jgi:hypothetical protein
MAPSDLKPGDDAAISRTAGSLAVMYWELAEELRQASTALATAVNPGDALPVVGMDRIAPAIKGGMLLRYLAEGRTVR